MSDFLSLVDAAIYTKLTNSPGTAMYGTRVYNMQAPEGVPPPFVVFTQIAGGNDNLTPNDSNDIVYQIMSVGATRAQAGSVNGFVQAAFGSVQYELNVTGYSNYALFRQQAITRIDNIGGTQFWRRGDNYRIEFDHT